MKRICMLLLACLLLPTAALAITEGVVEEAPSVAIELPDTGDKLFGKWEQGLADIERAARNVLEERYYAENAAQRQHRYGQPCREVHQLQIEGSRAP